MSDKPRRFIAGAVCPRCGLMDKIVVEQGGDERECVSCGFSDARPDDTQPAPSVPGVTAAGELSAELKTRVSRPAARRVETAPQVVRLVDPGSPRDSDSE